MELENISYPVIILAGGIGSRIKAISKDTPKLITQIAGRPFFHWFEASIKKLKFDNVFYLINDDKETKKFIYENSIFENVKVLSDGKKRLGTAGSINQNLKFFPDKFWIIYGDTLLNFDVKKCEEKFDKKNVDFLMTIIDKKYVNEFPNISIDNRLENITQYKKNFNHNFQYIDYGSLLVNKNIFKGYKKDRVLDLSQVLQRSISTKKNTYYITKNRFYEIGNIESFKKVEKELINKKEIKNLWF